METASPLSSTVDHSSVYSRSTPAKPSAFSRLHREGRGSSEVQRLSDCFRRPAGNLAGAGVFDAASTVGSNEAAPNAATAAMRPKASRRVMPRDESVMVSAFQAGGGQWDGWAHVGRHGLSDAQQLAIECRIGFRGDEIVERVIRHLDDVIADEDRAFLRAYQRVLQAALPFEHSPARVIVLRELAEDRAEVDLPVAQRAEAPRAIDPALVTAVHAGATIGAELGILHVKGADAFVIDVDEGQIVHLLQDHMAGVVEDVRARVVIHRIEETLERGAIV